jgi:hypothetical protein
MADLDVHVTESNHQYETLAALSLATSAHLLSPPKRARPSNRAITASQPAASAAFDVVLPAEEQRGKPPYDRQSGELRPTVDELAHEVNEALCAVANYLVGIQVLLAENDTASKSKLDKAINNALAQTSRACSAIRRQRSATR